MSTKKIYEYHLVYRPTDLEIEEGKKDEMLTKLPQTVFAKDEKTACMIAARNIPEKYADKLDQIEVAVRPF